MEGYTCNVGQGCVGATRARRIDEIARAHDAEFVQAEDRHWFVVRRRLGESFDGEAALALRESLEAAGLWPVVPEDKLGGNATIHEEDEDEDGERGEWLVAACMHTTTRQVGPDRCYSGTVNAHDENPVAHGGIRYTETCAECGARREVNQNGRHFEFGLWGDDA